MTKKILQIRKGEYLLELRSDGIATTYNKEIALDISNWDLENLGLVVRGLKSVGYKKSQVLTVEV